MGSEKRRISSDSGDAYARVVRREELQQELEQKRCQDGITQPDAEDKAEGGDSDEASDLFRQHSHQQSMEGG